MSPLTFQKTRTFFESLGVKTHLSQYGVTADKIPVVLKGARVDRALGNAGFDPGYQPKDP